MNKNLTSKKLEAALKKASDQVSAICDELIAAGRGHEKPQDSFKKNDPLSVKYREALTREMDLLNEKNRRLQYHGKLSPIKSR